MSDVPGTPSPAKFAFRSADEAAYFEERAAVREYMGGQPRELAERLALVDVLNDRHRRNRTDHAR